MRKSLLIVSVAAAVVIVIASAVVVLTGFGGKDAEDKPAAEEVAPDTVAAVSNTAAVAPDTAMTFTDSRDGQVYRIIKVGGQVWMAENLNYAVEGSRCYGEGGVLIDELDEEDNAPVKTTKLSNAKVQANCAKYGRLYNWEAALKACPAGFNLPSDDEWTTLTDYIGGEEKAGTKLKSLTGWESYRGVPAGTDNYGFSAMSGGYGDDYARFIYAGYFGFYWSATGYDTTYAWGRFMYYHFEKVFRDHYGIKRYLYSVRCVQDSKEGEQ
jgi:uncharacterized protein (TIGR02145 family)